MGDHPGRRRLAVRAGDGDDRDARRRPLGKEQIDDGLRDILWLAFGWVGQQKSVAEYIDGMARAAGLAHRLADVGREEVDAGDVEADRARRLFRDLDVVVVRLHGAVDRDAAGGHVGGGRQLDDGVPGRNLVEAEALPPDELFGGLIDLDAGQDLFMADATAWVTIGNIHELAHGVLAVADDVRRDPFRDRDHVTINDEHAIIIALYEALHYDNAAARLADGPLIAAPDLFLGPYIEADATSMVAVERLEDDRVADAGGDRGGLVGRADGFAFRHGQAGGGEQRGGQLLVPRNVDTQRRGAGGHGGADSLLVLALAELDKRLIVEPDVGDVAAGGLVENRLGRGAEGRLVGQQHQTFELSDEVEGRVHLHQMIEEPDGEFPGRQPDLLLVVAVDHVVIAGRAGPPRLASRRGRTRFALELERDMLGDVTHPGAVAEALDEAAGVMERAPVVVKTWQQIDQRVIEGRHGVRGPVLEGTEVDEQADRRVVRPVVGAAQHLAFEDLEIGL